MIDSHEDEYRVLAWQLFIVLLPKYFNVDREQQINDLTDTDEYLVLSLDLVEEQIY